MKANDPYHLGWRACSHLALGELGIGLRQLAQAHQLRIDLSGSGNARPFADYPLPWNDAVRQGRGSGVFRLVRATEGEGSRQQCNGELASCHD